MVCSSFPRSKLCSVQHIKLYLQVQELRLTAADAVKNKEDAEVKCQQKISDMVALMEKHKVQHHMVNNS